MKRSMVQQARPSALEGEFNRLLPACLQECAQGRWGLFGQNDDLPAAKWLHWPEAERLKELALEIQSIRRESGQGNQICERFLELCSWRGPNIPGEPKIGGYPPTGDPALLAGLKINLF
jgi:hypothetical protein